MQTQIHNLDAKDLRSAMLGEGINVETVIKITLSRNNNERQKIKHAYKDAFGTYLIDDFQDELSGDFQSIVIGLYRTPIEYDTIEIFKACDKIFADKEVLNEIIGTRSNQVIREIKLEFKNKYKQELESIIKKKTSSDHQSLLGK